MRLAIKPFTRLQGAENNMAEQMPSNTIALGDNAYMIESPDPAIADCLVMAHGGGVDKTRKFTVPAGVTIQFFAQAGNANKAPDGIGQFIRKQMLDKSAGLPIAEGTGRRTYPAQSACPDYILSKALGSHFKNVNGRASYLQVRNLLHDNANPGNGINWIPHVVTVRHRTSIFLNKNIWLSTLVADILAAKPGITTIYCANCRVDAEERKKQLLKTVGSSSLGSATAR